MRKVLLIILFLASMFYFFNERFNIKTGRAGDGTYQMVVVDTVKGRTYHVMGK
ncbi:MAG: hypothetical protein ABH871_01300 [Pseudomonadota bacterium]